MNEKAQKGLLLLVCYIYYIILDYLTMDTSHVLVLFLPRGCVVPAPASNLTTGVPTVIRAKKYI